MFGWGHAHGQQTFQRAFRCFSMALAPKDVPDSVKYGGKIFLPVSALEVLANLNIVYPMLFELTNTQNGSTTHCGVLEFIAEEGRVYIPEWMMTQLNLKNGEILQVKSATVPLGRFVKIQPQHENFLEITNPKAVLETALRNFACLSVGDVVAIKYNSKIFGLKVLEAKPANAISIIEADVEVDFAPPPGYVDPSTKKKAEEDSSMQMDEEIPEEEVGFVPFSGGGQSLNGKQRTQSPIQSDRSRSPVTPIASSSSAANMARSASPKQASPFGSMSGRSPSPRQPSPFSNFTSTNAAPMAVPAGKLVFGKTTGPSPSPSSSLSSSLNSSKPPTPAPASATPVPASASASSSGFVAFSGAGRSLK